MPAIYLSLLVYRLSHEENEAFLARLNVPSKLAQVTRETLSLRDKSKDLEASDLPRSQMYEWLRDCSPQAIRASIIASDSPLVRQRFRLFLSKLRRLRPSLNGDDLRSLGLPPGPQMGQILKRLHAARLDGEVSTREEETALVQKLLTSG